MSSISDPHNHSYTDTVLRFSHIKRKPPPNSEPSFRYRATDLRDPFSPILEIRTDSLEERHDPPSDDHILPFPSTSFDGSSSDTDAEGKISPPKRPRPTRLPRTRTVPSERFSRLVRVPPPAVDIDLLSTTRNLGALRPTILAEQTIIDPSPVAHISTSMDNEAPPPHASAVAVPETAVFLMPPSTSDPVPKKKKSFRQSTFDFMEKRRSAGRSKNVTVASISAPVIHPPSPRKFSVVSMASTANASIISLSAFPRPPENIPPVPHLRPFPPSKPDWPSQGSSVPEVVVTSDPRHEGVLALGTTAPPSADAGIERATLQADSSASRLPLPQAGNSYSPQVDPLPSGSDLLMPPSTLGTSSIRTPISANKGENRAAHFDFGEPPEFDGFDETQLPTKQQLETAAALPVISETGVNIPFGSLWRDHKTIVCFIRHFWCPLCQDYMFSISQNVSPDVLRSANIELVIVSNGSYEMIKSYRRIFRSPFALYTDPTHNVYNALGMTLQTLDKGPKGSYVRHGLMSGIGMVVVNAVKTGMPVWKDGGEISQLGGEFILGPGLQCSWVHRMRYTRSHVSILQVIEAAGVDMYTPLQRAVSSSGGSFLGMSSEEETKWMERRRKVLKKLRGKKMSRRGGTQWIDTASTTTASSGSNSNRSSIGASSNHRASVETSEVAGSLCSWNPATEQAINVGLTGYEDAIIEEAEAREEEAKTLEPALESQLPDEPYHPLAESHHPVDELDPADEPHAVHEFPIDMPSVECSSEALDYTKSEFSRYTGSLISQDDDGSDLGMSLTTDVDSAVDSQSDAESQLDTHIESVKFTRPASLSLTYGRGSYSSVGSGFEIVAQYHGAWFFDFPDIKKAGSIAASLSESSMSSF